MNYPMCMLGLLTPSWNQQQQKPSEPRAKPRFTDECSDPEKCPTYRNGRLEPRGSACRPNAFPIVLLKK